MNVPIIPDFVDSFLDFSPISYIISPDFIQFDNLFFIWIKVVLINAVFNVIINLAEHRNIFVNPFSP